MINPDDIMASEDPEALKQLKMQLFREAVRQSNEQRELEEAREKLIRERAQFRTEMDMLHHQAVLEQTRLKEENAFFDKKMEILKDGFAKLDMDRRRLEKERERFHLEQELFEGEISHRVDSGEIMDLFFRGADNPLTLRKRYRDLMKIFHPDNISGDSELAKAIIKEYERRKKAE